MEGLLMGEKYLEENKWWVSPYNFFDEVRAEFNLPKKVEIHDATLRDGEQTPGVVFRKEHKVQIAQMLDEVGVDRIEAGMPAVAEEDFAAIKEISKLGLKAKIYAFARAATVDIDKAVDCGAHGVVIEIPLGYPKLKFQFGWTWEDVVRKSVDCISYAKRKKICMWFISLMTLRGPETKI
jgi:methanogen homocitrate synthase